MKTSTTLFSLVATCGLSIHAAQIAWDNAESNSGAGFGSWSHYGFDPGEFISQENAAVDIGSGPLNLAFTLPGGAGGVAFSSRPFNGDLDIGQSFSIDLDHESIASGGYISILLSNAGTERFGFGFVGDSSNYIILDGSCGTDGRDTGVPFHTDGLHLAFTLTDTDSYSFTINGGAPILGVLAGASGTGINQVDFTNSETGGDLFFNNLAIVPEPAIAGLFTMGLLCLRAICRR